MARLIVVSNRIPLGGANPGGLVVAMRDALVRSGGLWIGSSGAPVEDPRPTLALHPGEVFERASFDLSVEEHENFYLGYANAVLWPICHGRSDLVEIRPEYLDTYTAVNLALAEQIAGILRDGDRIWVQDYHFFALAHALRALGVTNRIGFFLHIPFPGPQDLMAVPNAEELLQWLSAYDLVGLQTARDVANLTECGRQIAAGTVAGEGIVRLQRGTIRAGHFPIGIETKSFASMAAAASKVEFRGLTDPTLMIGVDRLDYSKGIPNRFRAFQHLLESREDLEERLSFLQVAPPTRGGIRAYQDIREETEHLAGRINGQFASINWTPIRYIHRAIPREVLAGLYRQAKIGLVTPLADGMNLVAKEYVAAQDPEDPGVLVLSRFAGAAEQMDDALLINPHDPYETADAIAEAMDMDLNTRRMRWQRLFDGLMEEDVRWWSERYLAALDAAPASATVVPKSA